MFIIFINLYNLRYFAVYCKYSELFMLTVPGYLLTQKNMADNTEVTEGRVKKFHF